MCTSLSASPSYSTMVDRRKSGKHYRRDSTAHRFNLIDTTTSQSLTEVLRFRASDYKYAALFSDGIHSFVGTQQCATGKTTEAISLTDVLDELWSFKNSHGAFVERRMKRFQKDCNAKGWHHADDLAIGVIHLRG